MISVSSALCRCRLRSKPIHSFCICLGLSLLALHYITRSLSEIRHLQDDQTRRILHKRYVVNALRHYSSIYQVPDLFCYALTQNDSTAIQIARNNYNLTQIASDNSFLHVDCSELRMSFITDLRLIPIDEFQLPVAFAIQMFKSPSQFKRLLQAIYRPHHSYCIHVDKNVADEAFRSVRNIAACFPNVLIASDRVAVQTGKASAVEAELKCMNELLTNNSRWRYLINLNEQEFPMKTMWQLSKVLNALNGSNNMEATQLNPARKSQMVNFTGKYNLTAVKGGQHFVVVRGFVEYVVNSPIAREFLQLLPSVEYPEETFIATLSHNPNLKIPGTYLGKAENDEANYPYISRMKNWFPAPCHGKYVSGVCVFSVDDFPSITNANRKQLFLNKVHWDYQHYVLDCLEKWFWNATITELREYLRTGKSDFNVQYYANLQLAHFHI